MRFRFVERADDVDLVVDFHIDFHVFVVTKPESREGRKKAGYEFMNSLTLIPLSVLPLLRDSFFGVSLKKIMLALWFFDYTYLCLSLILNRLFH